MKQKYNLKYTSLFYEDLNEIIDYIVYKLKNIEAANRIIEEIENAIEKRVKDPLLYEKYISVLNKKHEFYRIYVGNYIIFYIVYDNIMEIRRILNNKRNIRYFVKDINVKYKLKQGSY